ncbi:MAG: CAP domain-containing protein, partial [Terriglobales bacterium]
ARLMVERQQLSHQFDGEPRLMPRLLETGLRLDRVGENVAFNASAEKAFEALMQSPLHRRNLLDPTYNSAGFAAFWSNGRLYVVQDFAHQMPSLTKTSLP